MNHLARYKFHNAQQYRNYTKHSMDLENERVENQPIWRAEEDAATFWLVWVWTGVYYAPIWWMLESLELNYVNFSLKPHLPLLSFGEKQNVGGFTVGEWWFKESTNDGQNLEEARAFEGLWSFWSEMAFEQKCKKKENESILLWLLCFSRFRKCRKSPYMWLFSKA